MTLYGYGKLLDVDLSTGKIEKKDIDPQFARKFIGGMGFSLKILYDEVGPDIDPLSPDNILVFANGPLTGTGAPCSGRTEITNKSPLTGHVGTGNTGGIWGTRLKHAGFDVIIIRNEAEKPVYLWIDDDAAEIRDASHLWGKNTEETSNILIKELDPSPKPRVSVLTIGQAGENLVRYACPINDYHHVAGRGGAGAVMGAKKLKAIAVRGTGSVKLARPEEFRKATKEARDRLLSVPRGILPATDPRKLGLIRGYLPGKNFQTTILPDWLEHMGPDEAAKYLTKPESVCYGCPIPCFILAEVKEGKYAGTKANRGGHIGFVYDWGAKCAILSLPAIWRCKELCQQFGMDYVSAAGVIAFATELFQRGIITKSDTDNLELDWGNDDVAVQLLHKMALRQGFGDVLAEGSQLAAERIGNGADYYAMTIKGMEIMSGDPRTGDTGWKLGEITSPRGGDNVKNTHSGADRYNPFWWVDKFDMPDDVKAKIYSMPPEEVHSTWEGKPTMGKWFDELYSMINALGLCFFPAGFFLSMGPTQLSKMFSACTGWDTTPEEIMQHGERAYNLLKVYTAREGLTRKDDCWPDKFYKEPMPDGPSKGAVLSRDEVDRVLDEYYELRGWDKKTGLPTRKKLADLGLDDIADDLQKRGKLPN
ncbi:aldehyde ferredoxin oxidoreductase family protein [Chloroflexota bacterium]